MSDKTASLLEQVIYASGIMRGLKFHHCLNGYEHEALAVVEGVLHEVRQILRERSAPHIVRIKEREVLKQSNQYIQAIRLYRAVTGTVLKDAKEAVDDHEAILYRGSESECRSWVEEDLVTSDKGLVEIENL